ncbi:MAG: penicillin-binding protein [Bacteroidota bacterium]
MAKIINIKNEVLVRVYIVGLMIGLVALILIGQTAKLKFVEGDRWRSLRDSSKLKEINVEAEPGNIFAEDGSILATSLPFFDIRFDPTEPSDELFIENIDSLAHCLAQVNNERTDGGWKMYLTEKRNEGNKYVKIKEKVSYSTMEKMKTFPIFNEGRFGGGFLPEERFRRYRPFNQLALRTLGYTNTKSKVGLEGYFYKTLAGESGKRLMYQLGRDNWMPVSDLTEIEPKKGLDIVTTIDVNIQDIVHKALFNAVAKSRAQYGTAIVMEVRTGAIKAISNLEAFETKNDGMVWRERYNHAIGSRYEPGSTYKLASIMALLEDGYIELDDLIEIDSGKYQFYEELMEDSGRESFVTDTTTIQHAFEISSNVGIAKLVHQYYNQNRNAEEFIKTLKSFYLHLPTGIELEGEAAPYIKEAYNAEDLWSGTTLPWMAIGYESEISPIQLLNFYNTVANDGRMMKPYLVKEIQQEGATVQRFPPTVVNRRIASKSTIRDAKILLEGVVERGTASKLKSNRYRFAAKTGTSQTNYHRLKSKKKKVKHVGSFAGYFPAENPIYSCLVVIKDPKVGSYYGGDLAGPVFRQIADKCFETQSAFYNSMNAKTADRLQTEELPHNNLGYRNDFEQILQTLEMDYTTRTKYEWSVVTSLNDSLKIRRRTVPDKRVPNVVGMGLRDALYLLENKGLRVKVSGAGKVRKQSIIPGTRIRGQEIKLFLG